MKSSIKSLLVIEDDPGLQKQLSWCFKNYEVNVAGDRESALEQLKQREQNVDNISKELIR